MDIGDLTHPCQAMVYTQVINPIQIAIGLPPNPQFWQSGFIQEKKNEDRLSYLAKETSLNAPHRTIKANTRPSESKRPKIFIMGNLSNESNRKFVWIHWI